MRAHLLKWASTWVAASALQCVFAADPILFAYFKELMGVPGTKNTWAPEIYWDDAKNKC